MLIVMMVSEVHTHVTLITLCALSCIVCQLYLNNILRDKFKPQRLFYKFYTLPEIEMNDCPSGAIAF